MPQTGPTDTARVLAVIVLYKMAPASSAAMRTLLELRRQRPELARSIGVTVWDNSPEPQEMPEDFGGTLHVDPTNPGLAEAFNHALGQAEAKAMPWLMLLDQDTEVTAAYLDEVLRETEDAPAEVVAMLPRLVHRGVVVSPHHPRRLGPPVAVCDPGKPLQGFNSGAVVRCAAVQAMGGFDGSFPLEYLDHATFAALQRRGGRLAVLDARLQHDLSTDTGVAATAAGRVRQRQVLEAERRFYRRYGDVGDVAAHPLRLLRRAASVVVRKGDVASGVQLVRAALRACLPG